MWSKLLFNRGEQFGQMKMRFKFPGCQGHRVAPGFGRFPEFLETKDTPEIKTKKVAGPLPPMNQIVLKGHKHFRSVSKHPCDGLLSPKRKQIMEAPNVVRISYPFDSKIFVNIKKCVNLV
jgi:hypothetical protein